MVSTLKLAYFSGLVDGEGCICIKRTHATNRMRSPSYIFSLTIAMTDPRPITLFSKFFGVNQTISRSKQKTHPHWRDVHVFHIGGKRGVMILKRLMPYLICKREEAKVAIDFYEKTILGHAHLAVGFNRRPTPTHVLTCRHRYYLKLQALKIRHH